jgi:hypothetical protein
MLHQRQAEGKGIGLGVAGMPVAEQEQIGGPANSREDGAPARLAWPWGNEKRERALESRPEPLRLLPRLRQNLRDQAFGQRLTTTFFWMKKSTASRACPCMSPKKLPSHP